MMDAGREQVLVWTPQGRDAALTVEMLERQGIAARGVKSAEELVSLLDAAGSAIVAQEALKPGGLACIDAWLRTQPTWSDFPFVVLAQRFDAGAGPNSAWHSLGNVTVLERPLQGRTLLSAVHAALRARRRQYEVEQTILHRDEFLAMLGHELRNPLAAIALAVETHKVADDAGRKQRDILVRQVRHLTRLVDDLLDVARVTSGKVVLNKVAVDLNELALRCVQGAEISARNGSIQIDVNPASEPLIVHGDVVRLEEVVGNLLLNAIKYSPPRSRVQVTTRRAGETCQLEVKDTGIGIGKEMLPRVFDLFAQAEVPLDRSRGGLGIGLTVVKWLVELHGGSVVAMSEGIGRGSIFSITLPLAHPESRVLAAGSDPHRSPDPSQPTVASALPVLVVEDNADLLEMTKELLESFGCQVETANDGPTGLERMSSFKPALAFIDIGLPGLDGYSLASEVRTAPRTPQPWLVALTGYGQPEDRQRALAAGFDQHLTKPVSIAALRGAVEVASQVLSRQHGTGA
jgi:signal transduction histidine kinase/CheY-like chemotaxis protein